MERVLERVQTLGSQEFLKVKVDVCLFVDDFVRCCMLLAICECFLKYGSGVKCKQGMKFCKQGMKFCNQASGLQNSENCEFENLFLSFSSYVFPSFETQMKFPQTDACRACGSDMPNQQFTQAGQETHQKAS